MCAAFECSFLLRLVIQANQATCKAHTLAPRLFVLHARKARPHLATAFPRRNAVFTNLLLVQLESRGGIFSQLMSSFDSSTEMSLSLDCVCCLSFTRDQKLDGNKTCNVYAWWSIIINVSGCWTARLQSFTKGVGKRNTYISWLLRCSRLHLECNQVLRTV